MIVVVHDCVRQNMALVYVLMLVAGAELRGAAEASSRILLLSVSTQQMTSMGCDETYSC